MKKVILPLTLLLGVFCFSQTTTKKYNSFYSRYEYFDSKGNMTGYEKYNSFTKQWEYFTTNTPAQSRQPTQYREPAKLDLGIDVYNQQMALKQNRNNNAQPVITNNNINANSTDSDKSSSILQYKKESSDKFLNIYDQNFRELDIAAKKNYDRISHTLIANIISKSYKEKLDEFYSLAERFELNEANSKKLYNDVLYNVIILDNLANSYQRVKRITYFNSRNSIVEDSNDLNCYLMIDSKFVHFKTATNVENYRDLTDKTYNQKKSGYEYKSKYGAIFIPDDLTYVKFYDSQDFSGSYYIYYISK